MLAKDCMACGQPLPVANGRKFCESCRFGERRKRQRVQRQLEAVAMDRAVLGQRVTALEKENAELRHLLERLVADNKRLRFGEGAGA